MKSAPPQSATLVCVHARSALFDLYGDHLLSRGGWAPISAVVGLLGTLDISAPAVRTAVSRVVREGWLEPVERDVRGYAATAQARARLEEAHSRIYRTQALEWDGHWHVVAVERPPDRNARARLAQALGYLGYGALAPDTWVAPRESREPARRPAASGRAPPRVPGPAPGPGTVARGPGLGPREPYQRFADAASELGSPTDPSEAFAARSALVHAWRLFLFSDPGLPDEVLPQRWPGREAAALRPAGRRLMPQASAWVDAWLTGSPVTTAALRHGPDRLAGALEPAQVVEIG